MFSARLSRSSVIAVPHEMLEAEVSITPCKVRSSTLTYAHERFEFQG